MPKRLQCFLFIALVGCGDDTTMMLDAATDMGGADTMADASDDTSAADSAVDATTIDAPSDTGSSDATDGADTMADVADSSVDTMPDAEADSDAMADADAGDDADGGSDEPVDLMTLLGTRSDDNARDIAIDDAGNLYVVGKIAGPGLATAGAAQTLFGGGGNDAFLASFGPSGALRYFTYIGGSGYDRAYAVEVDDSGVVVAGRAGPGFPTSAGAVQTSFSGDLDVNPPYGPQDGFITKLSLDGSRVLFSTYVGGVGREIVRDIDIDDTGAIWAALIGVYRPVPTFFARSRATAFDATHQGREGMIARLDPDGGGYSCVSYVGGSANEVGAASVRARGTNAYFMMSTESSDVADTSLGAQASRAGLSDAFVVRIGADCRASGATYFGGTQEEGGETHNLALGPDGDVYVGAFTTSADMPTTPGVFSRSGSNTSFVARFSPDLRRRIASTYVSVGGYFEVEGIAVMDDGRVALTGGTNAAGVPTTAGALERSYAGLLDGFTVVLSEPLSSIVYASYHGGPEDDKTTGVAVFGNQLAFCGSARSRTGIVAAGVGSVTIAGGEDVLVGRVVLP